LGLAVGATNENAGLQVTAATKMWVATRMYIDDAFILFSFCFQRSLFAVVVLLFMMCSVVLMLPADVPMRIWF
jgi:hypothetical protein